MDPDLFIQFSNGNPLSCSTQTLIEPAATQAVALADRLSVTGSESPADPESPVESTEPTESEAGPTLTPIQLLNAEKRNRCIESLNALPEALTALDDYISESLDTIIDDLCLRRSALVLDQIIGIETGSVSGVLSGAMTATITDTTTRMTELDNAITAYEADELSRAEVEALIDNTSDQLDAVTQNINTGIASETAEKARIVKQHKAMSSTLRVQMLMENEDTQAILQNLGLS